MQLCSCRNLSLSGHQVPGLIIIDKKGDGDIVIDLTRRLLMQQFESLFSFGGRGGVFYSVQGYFPLNVLSAASPKSERAGSQSTSSLRHRWSCASALHDYFHMGDRRHPSTLNQQGDLIFRKDSTDVSKGRVKDIYMYVFVRLAITF